MTTRLKIIKRLSCEIIMECVLTWDVFTVNSFLFNNGNGSAVFQELNKLSIL